MKKDKKDKDSLTYQDSITAHLDCSFDDNTSADKDNEEDKENEDAGSSMTSAIWKVSTSVVIVWNSDYSWSWKALCNSPCSTIQSSTAPSLVQWSQGHCW